jgi:hypothetical protein
MNILHVFKSEPDAVIKKLMEPLSKGKKARQFKMYQGDLDYDKLVELVFENDKVICWW